jgi:hypothetical protein
MSAATVVTADVAFFAGDRGNARIDRARARQLLRCDEEELDRQIAAGLPQWTEHGEAVLGYSDVMNAGLYRGHPLSIPRLAERYLVRFADQPVEAWVREERWALTLSDICPEGCSWEAAPSPPDADAGRWHRDEVAGSPGWTLEATVRGTLAEVADPRLRDLYRRTLDQLRDGTLRYQYLPEQLRAAPDAARELGVCDCMTTACSLAQACTEMGVRSRLRLGYLLGMMPIEHAWLEVLDGGEYKPLDPVLAALVIRSGAEHAQDRIGDFCLGSLPSCVLRWPAGSRSPLVPATCVHAAATRSATARPLTTAAAPKEVVQASHKEFR